MVADSDGTDNIITIGGGTSSGNAATKIIFRTAADDTTTTGTERWTIDSSGHLAAEAAYDFTTTGNIYNKADNAKHYFGAGDDAYETYNSTDWIFNPRNVGTGDGFLLYDWNVGNDLEVVNDLEVGGDLNVTGDYINNGNTGITGSCVNTTYSGGIAVSCND